MDARATQVPRPAHRIMVEAINSTHGKSQVKKAEVNPGTKEVR